MKKFGSKDESKNDESRNQSFVSGRKEENEMDDEEDEPDDIDFIAGPYQCRFVAKSFIAEIVSLDNANVAG